MVTFVICTQFFFDVLYFEMFLLRKKVGATPYPDGDQRAGNAHATILEKLNECWETKGEQT